MAKSLRSKSKRSFRAAKRVDPKSDYRLAEDIRLNRLNSKLKQSALKPRALTDKEEYDRRQAGYETDDDDNDPEQQQANEANPAQGDMAIDGEQPTGTEQATATATTEDPSSKPSTSGPRLSRRETYKTDKGFMVRLPSKTVFRARGQKALKTGKPHRRR